MIAAIYIGPQSAAPGAVSYGQTGVAEELPENPGGTFDKMALFIPDGDGVEFKDLPYVVPVENLYPTNRTNL